MTDPVKKIGDVAMVPDLIRILEEEDPFSKEAAQAFDALGKLGPAAKEAAPTIMESAFLIGHPFAKARKYVLSLFGPENFALGPFWESSNRTLRKDARHALANIGEEAIPELLKGILIGDEERQYFCADVLGRLEGKIGEEYQRILSYAAPDIVPKLIEGLGKLTQGIDDIDIFSFDRTVYKEKRDAYVNALAQFGEAGVPYLINALPDNPKKNDFGYALANALNKIGAPAVPPLAEVFRNEEGYRLNLAFDALYTMGPAAREATLEFARCVHPQLPDPYCQRKIDTMPINLVAEGTLIKIGIGALPYVLPLLNDSDPSVRSAAMQAYGFFVSRKKNPQLQQDFMFAMIEKLQDPDAAVVAGAVSLLGQYAPGNGIAHFALPLLCSLRDDADQKENLRNSARDAIHAIEEKVL